MLISRSFSMLFYPYTGEIFLYQNLINLLNLKFRSETQGREKEKHKRNQIIQYSMELPALITPPSWYLHLWCGYHRQVFIGRNLSVKASHNDSSCGTRVREINYQES